MAEFLPVLVDAGGKGSRQSRYSPIVSKKVDEVLACILKNEKELDSLKPCIMSGGTMKATLVFSILLISPTLAFAQQPILRNGSCPSGYYSSGNYCVPTSSASPVIERNGSCPSGYYSSGNYCVMTSSGKPAIHRSGSCPSGYYSSGNYCVRSN